LRHNDLYHARPFTPGLSSRGRGGKGELQAPLQKYVGQIVLGLQVVRFAILLQCVVLPAPGEVRHVGNDQAITPIQQPGSVQQAGSGQRQAPGIVIQLLPRSPRRSRRLSRQGKLQQVFQIIEAGLEQVVLQAARRVQQAAQQRPLGKARVQQPQFLPQQRGVGLRIRHQRLPVLGAGLRIVANILVDPFEMRRTAHDAIE
jgi:hypothetical protein